MMRTFGAEKYAALLEDANGSTIFGISLTELNVLDLKVAFAFYVNRQMEIDKERERSAAFIAELDRPKNGSFTEQFFNAMKLKR